MKRNTYCLCSNVHDPLLPKAQNQLVLSPMISSLDPQGNQKDTR